MPAIEHTDSELVAESLAGHRDAFRQIVERYQILICSLAYSATGSFGRSEDLSQETFVTAWRQLGELREPSKLRPWLCGIVRFLIGKELRRQGHEPADGAEALDTVGEITAPEPLPPDQAISREEQAILWRSLESIPQVYREPMVLFYREHQSVGKVAAELDLTEDAVKQRLSRGRKILHERMLAFVEGAGKNQSGQGVYDWRDRGATAAGDFGQSGDDRRRRQGRVDRESRNRTGKAGGGNSHDKHNKNNHWRGGRYRRAGNYRGHSKPDAGR